jgi:hypothetical protein
MSYSGPSPKGFSTERSSTARTSSSRAAPASTVSFHGWRFPPEAARLAAATISRTVSSGTGSGRKARTERRVARASETVALGSTTSGAVLNGCPFAE